MYIGEHIYIYSTKKVSHIREGQEEEENFSQFQQDDCKFSTLCLNIS